MAIKAVHSTLPVATPFTHSKGKIAKFFLTNNPWKVFTSDPYRPKVFRYCLICGEARFSAEEWSQMVRDRTGSTTTCEKKSCEELDTSILIFIPQKHLTVTEEDTNRIQGALGREFFEEVGSDKKARSEAELSPELLKKLEDVPISQRLSAIDAIYFEYAKKHNIQLGKLMGDTSDPFLKALAEYRQQVSHLLKSV